ncbi:MAG: iron-sulfur cluster assembly protein [Desulfobacterales bacterium]|nr:iron-sulfur cluster assembly protein [Desulfobacterales bacterium]
MMPPEMAAKIASILQQVKDPESGLAIDRLGLVERVRYNAPKGEMYIFTDFLSHRPGCPACAGIAMAVMASIQRDLAEAFRKEFPDLVIAFV